MAPRKQTTEKTKGRALPASKAGARPLVPESRHGLANPDFSRTGQTLCAALNGSADERRPAAFDLPRVGVFARHCGALARGAGSGNPRRRQAGRFAFAVKAAPARRAALIPRLCAPCLVIVAQRVGGDDRVADHLGRHRKGHAVHRHQAAGGLGHFHDFVPPDLRKAQLG